MLGIKNMVKQNLLTKRINELNLSNLDLVSKIAQTISNNSKLSAAEALDDSVQNKLTPAYVDSGEKAKQYLLTQLFAMHLLLYYTHLKITSLT